MWRAHPIGFWLGLSVAACAPAPAPLAPATAATLSGTARAPSSPDPERERPDTITAPSEVVYPSVEPLPPVSVVLQYTDPAHQVPA